MKSINKLSNVVIDCLAVILCCLGMLLNLKEDNVSKPDMFVIAILLFLLCVSAYNLLIDKNGIIVKIDPCKDEIEQYIKENI